MEKKKAAKRSPPDNLTRWAITQSRGYTRKAIGEITRSVRACIYLVLNRRSGKIKYSR